MLSGFFTRLWGNSGFLHILGKIGSCKRAHDTCKIFNKDVYCNI